MKKHFLVATIALTVAACANTVAPTQTSAQPAPAVVKGEQAAGHASDTTITLEKIMSDPDWIARSPQSWYWGANSETVYFQQKGKVIR